MATFKMELGLEEVKKHIIESMFPSAEDGNPDDYVIDFYVDEDDELIITVELND